MQDFIITCDSGAGFSLQELDELGVKAAYLTYEINGKESKDCFESNAQMAEYYTALKTSPAKTSQAPPSEFIQIWEPALAQGKGILNISMSAELSGTYQSSVSAKEKLEQKYPGMIYTVDSVSGTFAQQQVVKEALHYRSMGKTLAETYEAILEDLKKYQIIFTVADFNHLRRGGRVSNVKALIGTVLNFKPVLAVDTKGRIALVEIHMSMNKSLAGVVKIVQQYQTDETTEVYISHGDNEATAKKLGDMLMAAIPTIYSVITGPLPPVLGAHGGPGCIVLSFKGKPRLKLNVLA